MSACPGCGLANHEGLCPVCRGDEEAYEHELAPFFGPWHREEDDESIRSVEQGFVLHAAHRAKAGSFPRQARGMLRAQPMEGADQSDASERFS